MENKRLYAIRGAICCENTETDIDKAVETLFLKIREKNDFDIEDMVSIQFTMTSDLNVKNPAASLRKMCNISTVPLFCSQEAEIVGMLPKVIRMLITVYMKKNGSGVYLNGAEKLRPDLVQEK